MWQAFSDVILPDISPFQSREIINHRKYQRALSNPNECYDLFVF